MVCLLVMAGHPMALTYPVRLFETAVSEYVDMKKNQGKP
jgi:hypothetical protein